MNFLSFVEKTDEDPIPADQLELFIGSISVSLERLFIETICRTGINPKVLTTLRWSDIDRLGCSFRIYDKKHTRIIYVPDYILQKYLLLNLSDGMPIFAYSDYTLKDILYRNTKRFFAKPKSWHSLRLTYLKIAHSKNIPLEVVAQNMGVSADSLLKYWSRSPDEVRHLANL